jgi:hypothetical protein
MYHYGEINYLMLFTFRSKIFSVFRFSCKHAILLICTKSLLLLPIFQLVG